MIRVARTVHRRFIGARHEFNYDLPYVWLDLQSLSHSPLGPLFSIDRFNWLSIQSSDYLDHSDQSIWEKYCQLRQRWGLDSPNPTYLLTLPKWCGYQFNPVSFYFESNLDGTCRSIVAEVTNTYHDKHVIYIPVSPGCRYIDSRQSKVFHVSPFLPDVGTYHFRILNRLDTIEIHIRLVRDMQTIFYANLIQTKEFPMTSGAIFRTSLRYPLGLSATMPRIITQAALLHFKKKVPAASRPLPSHPDTIRRRPPSRFETMAMTLVLNRLRRFCVGQVWIQLPNGESIIVGTDTEVRAQWVIDDYSVFSALVRRGELGLGESYVAGLWQSPSLPDLVTYFLRNRHVMKRHIRGTVLSKLIGRLGHWLRRNTVAKSRSNIQEHYDLSNELYRTFLDDHMVYSAAFFSQPDTSLADAQIEKIDRLIRPLAIQSHHHVLEIGSGWGAAAIRIAETTGCRVTTLTLSREQFNEVNRQLVARGLQDRITVLLEDYRSHRGTYDRIISIEMIEAVGYRYLSTYFKTIDSLLALDGIVALQAITIPDQRYDDYRRRVDWIQKYIFPGGHLPSLAHIQAVLAADTSLIIESVANIGPHYARTLSEWRLRFNAHRDAVLELGFDEAFIRRWNYYLAYCESGFQNRYINTLQIVLTRPVNRDLIVLDRNGGCCVPKSGVSHDQ